MEDVAIEIAIAEIQSVYNTTVVDSFDDNNEDEDTDCDVILGEEDVEKEKEMEMQQEQAQQEQPKTKKKKSKPTKAEINAAVENFVNTDCCTMGCTKKFAIPDIKQFRKECAALDYYDRGCNRLDIAILGVLRTICSDKTEAVHARRKSIRKRSSVSFMIEGTEVCRSMFLFCYNIKVKRFQRLLNTYKTTGMVDRLHGNCSRKSEKKIKMSDFGDVISFIKNYAEENGLFMPGRVKSTYRVVKLLPAGDSKASIYKKYETVIQCHEDKHLISLGMFRRIWRKYCPDIVLTLPPVNMCATCERNTAAQQNLTSKTEEEKLKIMEDSRLHLESVMNAKSEYQDAIQMSKEDYSVAGLTLDMRGMRPLNSYSHTIHISFDFPQRMHIPSNPQVPGALYFLEPYKVELFGIMNETDVTQANFIIPEISSEVSKGSNGITSYLHYYLEHFMYGEETIHFHADNSITQNKNNVIMAYFAWRIIKGLNKRIIYSFLPEGHTKFGPDWTFGLIRQRYRVSEAHNLQDIVDIVEQSGLNKNVNFAVLTGNEEGRVFVPVYNWFSFFQSKGLKNIPGISTYSQFTFTNASKGTVLCEKEGKSMSHNLFKNIKPLEEEGMESLSQIISLGLPTDRVAYLYEKIRPYVKDDFQDLLCPPPYVVEFVEER